MWWMIEMNGERESKNSVLSTWLNAAADDDDDDNDDDDDDSRICEKR